MSKNYFIPNADAEFDEWLQKFKNALKSLAQQIGEAARVTISP